MDESTAPAADLNAVWLPGIVDCIASHLPCNFVACTLRVVDKATAETLRHKNIVELSRPAPLGGAIAEHWESGAPATCKSLTLKQRWKLVNLISAAGGHGVAVAAIEAAGCLPSAHATAVAAGAGDLECYKYLAVLIWPAAPTSSAVTLPGPLAAAARGGHRAMCEWCLAHGAPRSWCAVAGAYSGGHTELAELLKPASTPSDHDMAKMLSGAAEGCSLNELERTWAAFMGRRHVHLRAPELSEALSVAVGSLTPDWSAKAEFLLARGATFGGEDYTGSPNDSVAARVLCLPPGMVAHRLDWMHARGFSPSQHGLEKAIRVGSTEGVRWLLDAGVRVARDAGVDGACRLASPSVNQLLVARGHVDPVRMARIALEAGSRGLPVLRWLLDMHGAEALTPGSWDFDTAARAGCTGAMELVLEHGGAGGGGVVLGESSWSAAAGSGCEEALEWLDRMGCPRPADGHPYVAAASNSDTRTMRALRRLGLPWGESSGADGALAAAVRGGADPGTFRWMVAAGCPVDWSEVERVAGRWRFDGELLAGIREEAAAAAKPGSGA